MIPTIRRAAATLALAATLAACGGGGSDPNPVAAPALSLSSDSLTFPATMAGGPAPDPQTVTITNSGGGTLALPTATVDYGGGPSGWLTATVAGAAAPFTLTVSVDGSALAEGPYTGTITVASVGTTNGPVAIQVSLTMSSVPPATVSCNVPADSICMTLTSPDAAVRGAFQDACTLGGGQAAACPTSGRLGPCTLPDAQTLWFYPPFTVDSAALVCTGNGGTWGGPPTSGGTATQVTMGCNFPAEDYCTDMAGLMTPSQKDAIVSMCTSYGGAVVTTCSTANRLGTCTYTEGSVTYRDRYYTASGATADSCFPGEVWTPN